MTEAQEKAIREQHGFSIRMGSLFSLGNKEAEILLKEIDSLRQQLRTKQADIDAMLCRRLEDDDCCCDSCLKGAAIEKLVHVEKKLAELQAALTESGIHKLIVCLERSTAIICREYPDSRLCEEFKEALKPYQPTITAGGGI